MNVRLLVCVLFVCSLAANGQQNNTFVQSPKLDFHFTPLGRFSNDSVGMFFPSSSLKPVIANTGILVAGRVQSGELRASMNTDNATDFTYGPLDISFTFTPDSAQWNKSWMISKSAILNHIQSYKKPGYVLPDEIKHWPINPPAGFEGILAPFIDWNSNGVYEPDLGESPVVEGDINVFAVYHDYKKNRTRADSGLGIEVKHFAYLITQPETNQYLILNRMLVTNKNTNTINGFKLGVCSDLILGGGNTNFVRSYPEHNAMVGFNAVGSDSIYGNNIPAFAIITLNRKLAGTMYLTTDDDVVTGYPTTNEQIQHYLSGKWRNGKALTYGGNGVDGSTSVRYVYPGLEDKNNHPFNWLESNSGSISGKRSLLLVFDSMNLASQATVEYRFAFQLIPGANNDSALIKQSIEETLLRYGNGDLTNVSQIIHKTECKVFPMPIQSNEAFIIESFNPINSIQIFDVTGRMVYNNEMQSLETSFQCSPALQPGIYSIRIATTTGLFIHKLMVQ
ncbi:MAG: T9SS type A sorting domain-containing protein [Bacteroidia bacterium]|nr:T9SS type A sorting domain-containing protein [Bacteroidia bacterium]